MFSKKCYLTNEDYDKIEEQIYLINGVRHLEQMCKESNEGNYKMDKKMDKEMFCDNKQRERDLAIVKYELKIAVERYLECINS